MKAVDLRAVGDYIHTNIGPQYHDKKLARLHALRLEDIVKRKNPYLFRAKGTSSAHEYVSSVLDAALSSGEETSFGNFLEGVAIFVAKEVHQGRKSGIIGIDLEFEIENDKYLVTIKSGPNWGNAAQIKALKGAFETAKRTLATSGGSRNTTVICVEGCCYGVDDVPNKGSHLKLCGQRFWELVSGGNEQIYRDLIVPLGHEAKLRNDAIASLCAQKLNVFTAAFVDTFCDNGAINWDRLVQFNSGKTVKS